MNYAIVRNLPGRGMSGAFLIDTDIMRLIARARNAGVPESVVACIEERDRVMLTNSETTTDLGEGFMLLLDKKEVKA